MKKGTPLKIIGIILMGLQLLSLMGIAKMGGELSIIASLYDFFCLIGYFLIGIIGLILLVCGIVVSKRKPFDTNEEKKETTEKMKVEPKANKLQGKAVLLHSIIIFVCFVALGSIYNAVAYYTWWDWDVSLFECIFGSFLILLCAIVGINSILKIAKIVISKIKNKTKELTALTIFFHSTSLFICLFFSFISLAASFDYDDGYVPIYILIIIATTTIACINIAQIIKAYKLSIRYKERCYKKIDRIYSYLERGSITQEEFDRLKQGILDKME